MSKIFTRDHFNRVPYGQETGRAEHYLQRPYARPVHKARR